MPGHGSEGAESLPVGGKCSAAGALWGPGAGRGWRDGGSLAGEALSGVGGALCETGRLWVGGSLPGRRAGLVPAGSLRRPGGEAPSSPRGRRIPEQISLLFFSGFFS